MIKVCQLNTHQSQMKAMPAARDVETGRLQLSGVHKLSRHDLYLDDYAKRRHFLMLNPFFEVANVMPYARGDE